MQLQHRIQTNEDGLSLLEIVIAVAVVAIFAVIGVLAFQNFTDNARQQAVERTAHDVFTMAMASEEFPGSSNSASGGVGSLSEIEEQHNVKSEEITVRIEKDGRELTVTASGWNGRYVAVRSTNPDRDGVTPPATDDEESTEEVVEDINDYSDGVFSFTTSKDSSKLLLYGLSDNATIDHASYDKPRPLTEGFNDLNSSGRYTIEGGFTHLGASNDGTWFTEKINAAAIEAGEDEEKMLEILPEGFLDDYLAFNEYIRPGTSPFSGNNTVIHEWKDTGTVYLHAAFMNGNIDTMPEPPTTVQSMYALFANAEINFDVTQWDMSNIVNTSNMFSHASSFNQNISSWDTSNIEDMSYMLQGTKFNHNVNSWDMSNVRSVSALFAETPFNNGDPAGISNSPLVWKNTGNLEDMSGMFNSNESFNQDVSSLDVSNVKTISSIFHMSTSFNNGGEPLDWEDTSNVKNMNYVFTYATVFNQDVSSWDTSNVESMRDMFRETEEFNQNLSSWDISNVRDMDYMFKETAKFNNGDQPLAWGDVSHVERAYEMFYNAQAFKQDLSSWNMPQVQEYVYKFISGTHPDLANDPSKHPTLSR